MADIVLQTTMSEHDTTLHRCLNDRAADLITGSEGTDDQAVLGDHCEPRFKNLIKSGLLFHIRHMTRSFDDVQLCLSLIVHSSTQPSSIARLTICRHAEPP
jgi:hypothetical protein